MLSRFKNNSILKYCIILLIILFTKIYSQDFQNQYNLLLNPDLSNQWWSQYNNYGQKPSQIKFHYSGTYITKKVNYNFRVFASKDKIYIGESFYKSKLFHYNIKIYFPNL